MEPRTQRQRFVLALIQSLGHPATADELHRAARAVEPTVGAATLYRTLRLLAEGGWIVELRHGNEPTRWALRATLD